MFSSPCRPEKPRARGSSLREEAAVGHCLVVADDDGVGQVPALPAGLAGSLGEVAVVLVELVALAQTAELMEHRAAQEGVERPIGGRRLGWLLVEEVVAPLTLLRVEDAA